jgi:hypothetical protein
MRGKPKVRHYSDDPEVQEAMRRRAIRNGIVRTAVIWTPLFIIFAGLLLFFIGNRLIGGNDANWFLLVVLAVFTLLFGLQAMHAMIDLRGVPKTMEGKVTRRWSRTDSFVSRSHYVRIDRQILRGDLFTLDTVKEGDRVTAEYYPRTGVLIALERIAVEEPAESEEPVSPEAEPAPEPDEPRARREQGEKPRVEPPSFGREPRDERNRVEPPTWDR